MNTPSSTLPDSPALAPRSLPPSERDFEIYHAIHIAGETTRSQASLHKISQTRVRQIIRRVVEWLAQVLPPQADIAKDQETHLARQIAADRFQHQLEEATESWQNTKETKYASLRIRLTIAQARLGLVGGRIDGLAADAIENLSASDSVGWDKAAPAAAGPPTELVTRVPPGNALTRGSSLADSPETAGYSVQDAECAAPLAKLQHNLAETSLTDALAEANSVLRAGAILLQEQPLATADQKIKNPPPGDCSPNEDLQFSRESDSPLPQIQNQTQLLTCDHEINVADTHPATPITLSQPLLNSSNSLPVTKIQLTPQQPGANLSTTSLTCTLPSDLVPSPAGSHSVSSLVP